MRLPSALAPVILLAATSSLAADNVILVTLDGVRIQELFSGFDPMADMAAVHQSDVAATILKLLGLDYRELDPEAGPPIEVAFKDSEVLTK